MIYAEETGILSEGILKAALAKQTLCDGRIVGVTMKQVLPIDEVMNPKKGVL